MTLLADVELQRPIRAAPAVAHPAIIEAVEAARDLAWWSHSNIGNRRLYDERKAAFARLRDALARIPSGMRLTGELRVLVAAAWTLAACSDSNRWGEPYYIRKSAFARLRGCLRAYDVETGRVVA